MTVRLINISKDRLQQIDPMTPLISISDRYSSPVIIPHKEQRPLLQVEFFPRDHAPEIAEEHCMTPELANSIIKFALDQQKAGAEVIYVQCGEGRIRSFTIVAALEMELEGFHRDASQCCIKQGLLDRYTYHVLGNCLDLYNDELNQLNDLPSVESAL